MTKTGRPADDAATAWLKGRRNGARPEAVRRAVRGQKTYRTPAAPSYLDDHGKRCWQVMHRELHERGLLERVDVFSLEQLAFAFQTWRQAAEALAEEGATVPGDRWKDARKKNPAWQVAREAGEVFVRLSDRFGLSPQARERLNLDDTAVEDWTSGW